MPFETWHDYGYGVITSDIKKQELTAEKLDALIKLSPDFYESVKEYFEECEINEPSVDDYLNLEDDNCTRGLHYILREVIHDVEGIDLLACENFGGQKYLIYLPCYPWQMNEMDYKVTPTLLDEIFNKYLRIICDTIPDIDYQSCKNGG